ncbi:hypothetical protein AB1N83_012271 [Pleurotus pulmonarius]
MSCMERSLPPSHLPLHSHKLPRRHRALRSLDLAFQTTLSLQIHPRATPVLQLRNYTWIDACLRRFVNPRELELQFWSELQAGVRSRLLPGITSMISTTGLRRLALQDWDTGLPSYIQPILFACSTTLEHLVIHFRSRGALPTTTPVVPSLLVRLEALRRLELCEPPTSFTGTVDIECPNLETFTTSYGGVNHPWELPARVPESISELNLQATGQSGFPQLRRPIHPSRHSS